MDAGRGRLGNGERGKHQVNIDPRRVISMSATDYEGGEGRGVSLEAPVWSRIENGLRRALIFDGSVQLWDGYRKTDSRTVLRDSIRMVSEDGWYMLSYLPAGGIGEKSRLRLWWEPGDEPFRGLRMFDDFPHDDRVASNDINVALDMFKDFFDDFELSIEHMAQFRSVSDPKPR